MSRTVWRSFIVPLTEITTNQEYAKIETLLDKLQIELEKQWSNTNIIKQASLLKSIKSNGNFRDDYTLIAGKPHINWTNVIGNKAKYQRFIIERIRITLLSQHETNLITTTCAKYNWNIKKIDQIRQELSKQKIYIKQGRLLNLLDSKKPPSLPQSLNVYLDFTTGDSQIVKQVVKKNIIESNVLIEDQWVKLNITIPKHLRKTTGKYAKPIIQRTKTGEIIIRISYEIEINKINKQYIMGVDLGKIKPFSAAVNYNDGSYSTELSPSKETDYLNNKLRILQKELKYLYPKKQQVNKLLVGRESLFLAQKINDFDSEIGSIKEKIILIKEHLGWCIARDIINHAVKHNVRLIQLEDLSWLKSSAGKWDFSAIQEKIQEVAELEAISCVIVDAHNSSHTDPFSDFYVSPNNKRLIKTDNGLLDRDYVAGLELSRRNKKVYNKKPTKSKILKKNACRDKHSLTPKRPKQVKRKYVLKQKAGVTITVLPLGRARVSDVNNTNITLLSNKTPQSNNHYTKVLQ